ncbi:MAG: D-alanine--D-alanine ligase family protein [Thermoguttaceae bacterium]
MRVTILHQTVDADAPDDDKDVLVQAATVTESLQRLGHSVRTGEATLDLEQTRLDLVATDPDRVFYLVESLDGTDCLAHIPAFLLETMGIPYTGAPAASLVLTNHKIRAKRMMALAGLPTPPWWESCRRRGPDGPGNSPGQGLQAGGEAFPARYILKPVEEHASVGMTDECVGLFRDEDDLRRSLEKQSDLVGGACFAERYIEGREFNVAILGTPEGPIVLPPAEIDFSAFPPGKPRIVGYDAKWASGSFEFENTPRCFPCVPGGADFDLGERLAGLARRCWTVFGLRGYVRVDFRLDGDENPWILEINTNPCLSPDAGYAAALVQGGIGRDEAIQSILDDCGA